MSGESGVSNNISAAESFNPSASPEFVSYLFELYNSNSIHSSISFEGIELGGDIYNRLILTGMWLSFRESADERRRRGPFVSNDQNGKPHVLYDEIADFVRRYFAVLTVHGVSWIYDSRLQMYRENKNDIEKLIDWILRRGGIARQSKIWANIGEIVQRIKIRTTQIDDPFNRISTDKKIIAVTNGILLLPEKRLVDNSPAWAFTYCINATYNPSIDSSEMEQYLNGLVHDGDEWKLKQMGACCLIREAYKKSYFIYNRSGNNGKSTYLNILTALLGKDNISALTLQEIAKDKFRGAELYGKSANINPELPREEIDDPTYFKAVTGEDLVTAERKFCHPFTFQNKAILIFGANTLPKIGDMSPSIMKRLVLIEFPNIFQIDPNFTERMTTQSNRSALLNIFLDYLVQEVIPNGVRRTEDDYEATIEAYRLESNSVYRFFTNCIDKGVDYGELHFNEVYQAYVAEMDKERCRPESKRKFTSVVESEIGLKIHFVGPRGEQVRKIEGVRWKQRGNAQSLTSSKAEVWE